MRIAMTSKHLRAIQRHAVAAYPLEAAGLLIGRAGETRRDVLQVKPLENSFEASAQTHRYLIDPRTMLEAEEQADQAGLAVVGVYHSHPDHPPLPSEYDRRNAWPWLVYTITSVENGRPGSTRAWLLDDDRRQFDELELVVENPSQEQVP